MADKEILLKLSVAPAGTLAAAVIEGLRDRNDRIEKLHQEDEKAILALRKLTNTYREEIQRLYDVVGRFEGRVDRVKAFMDKELVS